MRISLFIGQSADIHPELAPGLVSAIDKHESHTPLWCRYSGLEGDEQSDQRHHGGPDRPCTIILRSIMPGGRPGKPRWACRPPELPGSPPHLARISLVWGSSRRRPASAMSTASGRH